MKIFPFHIITTLIYIIPCFVLLFQLSKDTLKASAHTVLLGICVYLIFAFIGTRIYFRLDTRTAPQSLLAFATMFIGICIFSFYAKYNFWQNIFAVIVAKSYTDDVRLLAYYVYFLFTGKIPGIFMPVPSLISILLIVFTFPFIYLFFTKLLRPALDYSAFMETWKLMWIIPLFNSIIYTLIITPDAPIYKGTLSVTFYFLPPLWIVLTFSTYFLLVQIIVTMTKNSDLQKDLQLSEMQANAQQKQNENLQERIEETGRIRHDIRHHLLVIDGFAQNNDSKSIRNYLEELFTYFPARTVGSYCENISTNALLSYFHDIATEEHIDINFSVTLKDKLPFPDSVPTTVLGNLLENSIEACRRMRSEQRFITLKMSMPSAHTLVILVENSFEGEVQRTPDGAFLSSKAKGRKGIGLSSVHRVVKQYNGVAKFEYEGSVFKSSILMSTPKEHCHN